MRRMVRPRRTFISSLTFSQIAAFHSVPAASAALRCAASTPLKNRSPGSADRFFAPVPRFAPPTIAASRRLEKHSPVLGETRAANDAERWRSLLTPVLLRPAKLLPPAAAPPPT